MRSMRAASPTSMVGRPRVSAAASRASCSSPCTRVLLQRRRGGPAAGNAPERGADAHAHAGGVALAEHVAGHHLAGDEQVVAALSTEAHGSGLVGLQPEV